MSSPNNDHYKKRIKDGIETINICERLMCNGIPEDLWDRVIRNFNIAQSFKYIDRFGAKGDTEGAFMCDLEKAEDYIYRAKTGKFKSATIAKGEDCK